ncbi:MAG: hypothetical protein CMN32_10700 [Saprospirales bacterium]|nr:hypothetical protein [Saprospirales bacterium]
MQINFTTPALLFPAISLLILAYTNKFLAIASLIRNLHSQYQKQHEEVLLQQIATLQRRVFYIRMMQLFAILSFLMCFVCMFMLYFELQHLATTTFALSLLMMIISLGISLVEIAVSSGALNLLLKGIEEDLKAKANK